MAIEQYTETWHSVSGTDIQAVIGNTAIGTIQGISFTVTREKAPIYTMGDPNPRAFTRGKRGIAGSMIFAMLFKANLIEDLGQPGSYFWAKKGQMTWETQQGSRGTEAPVPAAVELGEAVYARAWYHDQLPPFDITLTAITESGDACRMSIRNVEILNSGSGISIDDITTDENMTFVARSITPWRKLAKPPANPAPGTTFPY